MSSRLRKRVEESFGWSKTVGTRSGATLAAAVWLH
jgi:hypothetical protein